MKTLKRFIPILGAAMLIAALAGCTNPLSSSQDTAGTAVSAPGHPGVPAGFGQVRVVLRTAAGTPLGPAGSQADVTGRTIYPAAPTDLSDFDHIVYTMSKEIPQGWADESIVTPSDDVVTLSPGRYYLSVYAYAASDETDSLAAKAKSANFTIEENTLLENPILLTLEPITDEGQGSLSFSINYPAGTTVTSLTWGYPGNTPSSLLGDASVTGDALNPGTVTGNLTDVDASYYLIRITLEKEIIRTISGSSVTLVGKAGRSEIVHIYANMESSIAWTFEEDAFNATIPFSVNMANPDTDSAVEIAALIDAAITEGEVIDCTSSIAPLTLKVSNLPLSIEGLTALLQGIYNKYVHLEISSVTGGTQFPNISSISSGVSKGRILSLTLPAAVTSIAGRGTSGESGYTGNGTFQGFSGLKSIDMPGVVTLGSYAFSGCNSLVDIKLPAATTLEEYAFAYCSMTRLDADNFPALQTVGDHAFASNYYGLTTIDLDALTSIGNSAFQYCQELTSVNLSAAAPIIIGDSAFYGDTEGNNKLTSFTAPGVTEIGRYAFQGNVLLSNLAFPNATTIKASAFHKTALTTFEVGPYVTDIDVFAFRGAESLASITVAPGNTYYAAYSDSGTANGILYDLKHYYVDYAASVALTPAKTLFFVPPGKTGSIRVIGDAILSTAFSDARCVFVDMIGVMNMSINNRPATSFAANVNLTRIDILSSNNYRSVDGVVYSRAADSGNRHGDIYYDDTTLLVFPAGKTGSFTIPGGITKIDQSAFAYSKLSSLDIPVSVRTFGQAIFSASSLIDTITVHWTETLPVPSYESFHYLTPKRTLMVPYGTLAAYTGEGNNYWSTYFTIQERDPSTRTVLTAALAEYTKPEVTRSTAAFSLTSSHTAATTWRVYTTPTGAALASGVSAGFADGVLTLTKEASGILQGGTYYVSAEETADPWQNGKDESPRLALTVKDASGSVNPLTITFWEKIEDQSLTTSTGTILPDGRIRIILSKGADTTYPGAITLGAAPGEGFSDYQWYYENTGPNPSSTTTETYDYAAAQKAIGNHSLTLQVKKGTAYYSVTFDLEVRD